MRGRTRLALIGFLLAAAAPPAAAGETREERTARRPDTLRYVMEEIVVHGRRSARPPSTITEIGAGELSRRIGSTVAEMLLVDPGLRVTSGAKAETETSIRGFPARDVLVLLDGRPLNPGYYGKVDLSMLPIDNIAKIKVVKGPSSVAYGANSMGGVVNIVTRNGWETPRTTIAAEGGSAGYRREAINHGGRRGRLNWWLTAYESAADGFPLSDDFTPTSLEDGDLRDNASWWKAGITGKLGFERSPAEEYAFSLGWHTAEKDVPSTIYAWDDPRYREFPEWARYHAALNGRWLRGSDFEAASVVFVDAYRDRFIEYIGAERDPAAIDYDSDLENWTVGFSGDVSFRRGPHRLRAGAAGRRDLFNKRPDIGEPWASHHLYTGNLFAEDAWLPRRGTEAMAGVGWSVAREDEGKLQDRLCPMLSFRQELPGRITLRGAWARAVRFPTLHHFYSSSSGNPDLKPEEADKTELGLERLFLRDETRFVSISVAWFHNDLENLIYRASRTWRYENIGEARTLGVEARVSWRWTGLLSGSVGWAWIDPERSTRELMEETPPHKVDVHLRIAAPTGTMVDYRLDSIDDRITWLDGFVLRGYTVHGISVSQTIGRGLSLRLQVANITDERYEDELGYPSSGRRFIAGIAWSPWGDDEIERSPLR